MGPISHHVILYHVLQSNKYGSVTLISSKVFKLKLKTQLISDLFWINPQYHVHLKDPDVTDNEYRCTLVVSLMEKQTDKNKKIAIGFGIYKVQCKTSSYRQMTKLASQASFR